MTMILAIDLGKFNSVFCEYQAETGDHRFFSRPTTREHFRQVLTTARPDRVVFETCTVAGWVADLCREIGLEFQAANTMDEAWSYRKVKRKTDRDDALKLARMAARGELPTVHVPERAVRQRRSLIQHRDRLITLRTARQNRLRALAQQEGLLLPTGARAWTQAGLETIARHAKPLAECALEELWRGMLHLELEALRQVMRLVAEVERKLDALAAEDAQVQLLTTIPGVGRRTAEVIAAYVDDPRRFRNARQVSAYAGLVPKQFQSGERDRRGRITRRGPSLLRKLLVEVGWCLVRYNIWAARLVERISRGQKTRRKQAIVALARKLLVRCWAMLRDGTPWKEPELAFRS